MKYKIHSFRHAEVILANENEYIEVWQELLAVISSITDDEIKIGMHTRFLFFFSN